MDYKTPRHISTSAILRSNGADFILLIDTTPAAFFFISCSEATQCITLYSRQGTTETIEEEEDEQDHGEDKPQASPSDSQQPNESQEAGYSLCSDGEPRETEEEEGMGQERLEGVEEVDVATDQKVKESEKASWESFGPDEGPSLRLQEAESALSVQEKDFTTDSEDREEQQDFMQTEDKVGLLYTPDTDASKTSDAEVPPSYSKAVSFDRLEVSDDDSDMDRKRRMVMTSDSRSDSRSDIMLPSMTTELTASELLLNK